MLEFSELSILLLLILLAIGLVALSYGGDILAKGAASLALNLKVNPVVIGLTVVSIATSMPEFFASFFAAKTGNHDLVMGNILGSNLCNIGLIMGVAAMIYPIRIQRRLIIKEMPILLAATLVFSAVAFDQQMGRIDGLLLTLAMLGYLAYMVKSARHGDADMLAEALEEIPSPVKTFWACVILVAAGSALLAAGAHLLVESAVVIAERMGVSQALIGLTLVAIGTSLPELAASVAAARRKQSSICAGNIIGSNIFNMLFVGGSVATVFPLRVDGSLFQIEFPAMLLLTAMLWLIFTTDKLVTRLEGIVLLAIYGFIIYLSASSNFDTIPSIISR